MAQHPDEDRVKRGEARTPRREGDGRLERVEQYARLVRDVGFILGLPALLLLLLKFNAMQVSGFRAQIEALQAQNRQLAQQLDSASVRAFPSIKEGYEKMIDELLQQGTAINQEASQADSLDEVNRLAEARTAVLAELVELRLKLLSEVAKAQARGDLQTARTLIEFLESQPGLYVVLDR